MSGETPEQRALTSMNELQGVMVDALRAAWDEFKANGISVLGQEVGFGDRHGVIRFTPADTARLCASAIAVRAAELEAIVRDLAAIDGPDVIDDRGVRMCGLCGGGPGEDEWEKPQDDAHYDNCPWRRARELMSTQPDQGDDDAE